LRPVAAHSAPPLGDSAEVIQHQPLAGGYYQLRLALTPRAPLIQPGQLVQLAEASHPQPLPVMGADERGGWLELLYHHGGGGLFVTGLRLAPPTAVAEPFQLVTQRPRPLLIAEDEGLAAAIFWASQLRREPSRQPLVLYATRRPFPSTPTPSRILVPGLPGGVIATIPLLDDWGIAARLASAVGQPGCFDGTLTELAGQWLVTLDASQRDELAIYYCGPVAGRHELARLARSHGLPLQARCY